MKMKFERMRFIGQSIDERQEVEITFTPHPNPEIHERRAYAALFKKYPEWGTGHPVKNGVGFSSALQMRD